MDDGETAVASGLRCLPEYQGLGMTKKVMAASLEMAKANFPHLRIQAKTIVDFGGCDKYRQPNPRGTKITFTRVKYLLHILIDISNDPLPDVNCEPICHTNNRLFNINISKNNYIMCYQ